MTREIKLNSDLGFMRIGAAVPRLKIADTEFNIKIMSEQVKQAAAEGVQILAFPEMSITGYTLGDLVQHQALLDSAEAGLKKLLSVSKKYSMVIMVGMPVFTEQRLYNCGIVINEGHILGAVPKSSMPTYKEFYDDRWFSSGHDITDCSTSLAGQDVPFGTDLLFRINHSQEAIFALEICEDLWMPLAPHEYQAMAGATLLFNLSASNEVLGKADWRRTMVTSESGRCQATYCYTSSSIGESSNDMVFGGHAIIAENGSIVRESKRLNKDSVLIIADTDLERLAFDRRSTTSFRDHEDCCHSFRIIDTEIKDITANCIQRELFPHPFVPSNIEETTQRCREIFSMQVGALVEKLSGAKLQNIVIGISGGLDSTLALLVAERTMRFLNLPATNIYTFTLPGFGTTDRTLNNSRELCKALGVSFDEVDITRACEVQLKDLKHQGKEDIVFENVQARYRTAFLFNKANELNAIMLGTGDLTEVALGWSTFAGDQVSHYHINVSVPKTLVRYLVNWVAETVMKDSPAQNILRDILETPISPELLTPQNGEITQKSEDIIGPVELTDFYLYRFIRFGMKPGKILFIANEVLKQGLFDGDYDLSDLYKWLRSFIKRFFANQFKRTCMPEGPKIGTVSLSPRADWRMPSEAEATLWLADLEDMYDNLHPNEERDE